jgi:acyl-CoA synthetase (AMP-forming)/AMP-acid ligase II
MYGLTEAFRSTYLDPSELRRRPDSIGKAVPHADILVLGPDGRECAPGEVGELVHRGPLVSKGYWGRPEETAQKIRQNPLHRDFHDPVCFSGDFVKKDEEGFLYFIGRRDGMIKCAGYRISPGDIEEALFRNEAVREAAVVGIGDDTLGQKIMAVVVLKKGSRLSEAELLAHCARELPSYMTPQILRVVEALPKTPNGKPDRAALALGA